MVMETGELRDSRVSSSQWPPGSSSARLRSVISRDPEKAGLAIWARRKLAVTGPDGMS
jgi:hypothetical protein